MTEIPKNSGFLFDNFLESLTGETTSRVASEIKTHLDSGRLQVVFNPAVQISQVTQYNDGSITLFLPSDYSHDRAVVEYPRILPDILKYSRESSNNAEEVSEIEEKIRAEAKKS